MKKREANKSKVNLVDVRMEFECGKQRHEGEAEVRLGAGGKK